LGRDKFVWNSWHYKLNKINFKGSILIKKVSFCALKKVDGSVFFWPDFSRFGPKSDLYGFIEKQAPQKALCLGPDPPPGENINFIDFYWFLTFLGPSIEPEKVTAKSASTANPPQNDHFIEFFNLSRPNLAVEPFFIKIY
jgi:hypothetical protein